MGGQPPSPIPAAEPPADQTSVRARAGLLAAALVLIVAGVVRLVPVLSSQFPLGDGGLFLTMAQKLQAEGFALPGFVSYNGTEIPFAYPPLGLYVMGLLAELPGMSDLDVMRFMPLVVSVATVGIFLGFARSVFSGWIGVLAATFAYAVLPLAFRYFIMGAGVTRAVGMLLALLTVWLAYLVCTRRRPVLAVALAVAAGLTILSHPNASWFAAYSSVLVFVFFCRDRRALALGLLAVGGALVIVAPWLAVTVARHGVAPFITAFQSENPGTSALELLLTLQLTQEPWVPFLGALAVVGVIVSARDRQWWLPVWLLAACVLDTRYQGTFAMVPLALLVGVSAVAIHDHFKAEPDASRSRRLARAGAFAVGVWVVILSVAGALQPVPALRALPDSNLEAMRWVATSTPTDTRFLVVAPTGESAGSESEWFPVIAERRSLGTYQGLEWLPQPPGPSPWERYNELQACGSRDVDCLEVWATDGDLTFEYVFVREAGTERLRASLDAAPGYVLVHQAPDVWIYVRSPVGEPPDGLSDGEVTVVAVGDIASCDSDGDEATAALVQAILGSSGGHALVLGDLAYQTGSAMDFEHCYDPSWGRFRNRTLPTPGNHEYETPGASAYFDYFADVDTGNPAEGWYDRQLDLGWWLVSLNSNCDEVGGCGPGSAQLTYLTTTLDRIATEAPDACVVAIWHHPRWSSGDEHGSDPRTDGLWRALADAGADIVLSGHDHSYERFVPMDADGAPAPGGITEFVVGTGGRSLYGFGDILPTSAVHDDSTFGVLELTLREGGYDWTFVPTSDGGFSDTGSASCPSSVP